MHLQGKPLYLDFLQTKLDLLTDNPQSKPLFDDLLARLHKAPNPKLSDFKQLESTLEEFLTPYDLAEKREIDRQLMERFGFTRIGADPAAVSRRVLKRGRIKTLEELEIVRNLIADQGNIATLGTETYDQLALLLDQKEAETAP
jgi:hypothetical protein